MGGAITLSKRSSRSRLNASVLSETWKTAISLTSGVAESLTVSGASLAIQRISRTSLVSEDLNRLLTLAFSRILLLGTVRSTRVLAGQANMESNGSKNHEKRDKFEIIKTLDVEI